MAASGDAVGSGVGEVGPNDRTEGDPTGARPASSRSTRAAGPTLRAHVGIDAATRTPVFRGAERAGDEEDQVSMSEASASCVTNTNSDFLSSSESMSRLDPVELYKKGRKKIKKKKEKKESGLIQEAEKKKTRTLVGLSSISISY